MRRADRAPRLAAAFLCLLSLWCLPRVAGANNVITAEHPPFGDKGYALQFDDRFSYQYSDTFVAADGGTRYAMSRVRQGQFIFRLFIPDWMLRVSTVYSHSQSNDKSRHGWGDTIMEAGASRESGDWRLRALLLAKAPTGSFDKNQAVNVGSGQWDLGAVLSVTRYLFSKNLDLDLYAQYLHRLPNTKSGVRPGGQFTYALASSWLLKVPFAPMRLGMEHRGLLADPNRRDGRAVGAGQRQFSIGPVAMVNLNKILNGLSLWPTAQFDVYDRNYARTQLYYLKIQYCY